MKFPVFLICLLIGLNLIKGMATEQQLKDLLAKVDRQKRYISRLESKDLLPILGGDHVSDQLEFNILKDAGAEFRLKVDGLKELIDLIVESEFASEDEIYSQVDYMSEVRKTLVKLDMALATEGVSNLNTLHQGGQVKQFKPEPIIDSEIKVKLPEYTLPEFYGGVNGERDFQVFFEIFQAIIDRDDSIPKVLKVNYLRSCLKLEAFELIEHIPAIENNYETYKDILMKRYGSDKGLITEYTNKLLGIVNWGRCESPEQQRKLCDHVFKYTALLEGVDPNYEPNNPMLLNLMIRLLPKWLVNKIVEKTDREKKNVKKLVEFIETQIRNTREAQAHYRVLGAQPRPQTFGQRGKVMVASRQRGSGSDQSRFSQPQGGRERDQPMQGGWDVDQHRQSGSWSKPPKQGWQSNGGKQSQSEQVCIFCDKFGHISHNCRNKPSPDECFEIIKNQNRCLNCLKVGHRASKCFQASICKCSGKQKHNPSICKKGINVLVVIPKQYGMIFLPTVWATVRNRQTGENIKARILVDTGAHNSYATLDVARDLKCEILEERELHLNTFGSQVVKKIKSPVIEVEIVSRDGPITLQLLTQGFLCNPIEGHELSADHSWKLREYLLADPEAVKAKELKIDIIVGLDQMWQIVGNQMEDSGFGPRLLKSKVGWILAGSVAGKEQRGGGAYVCHSLFLNSVPDSCKCDLYSSLAKFWELDSIGIKQDKEISPVLEHAKQTIKFLPVQKRFEASLPWKGGGKDILPVNYNQSKNRLRTLQIKFQNPKFKDFTRQYKEIIESQIAEGILEPVDNSKEVNFLNTSSYCKGDKVLSATVETSALGSQAKYYIPHHGVIKKGTNKLRVVLDASARSGPGCLSLNDCLHSGPNLFTELTEILLRFRMHNVVLVSDITKAFLQISINPYDRDALRILWPEEDSIKEYRYTRLPFGLVSSAFILTNTLQAHLQNSLADQPQLLDLLLKSWYMDDFMGGGVDDREVLNLREQVEGLLAEANMPMHDWNSNSKAVREACGNTAEGGQSVLGIQWSNITDTLNINIGRVLEGLPNTCTKRDLLGVYSKVFDPPGFLAPFTLLPKILFQKLCHKKGGWRDELPIDIAKEWEMWKSQLKDVEKVEINRQVVLKDYTDLELHGFCDASPQAYAVCIYIRSSNGKEFDSNFLIAKSRLAPDKSHKLTMPRLELMGALLLSRLMSAVVKFLSNVNFKQLFYYTDSKNVLYWIQSSSSMWSVFVCNRIREIQTLSHSSCWRYVRSERNPADLATRPFKGKDLVGNLFWFKGPSFLVDSQIAPGDNVELNPSVDLMRERKKCVKVVVAVPSVLIDFNTPYFSSFSRIQSVMVIVLKAVYKLRRKEYDISHIRRRALLELVKQEQGFYYSKERDFCKQHKGVVSGTTAVPSSIVRSLRLFIDRDGVLRSDTRIPEGVMAYGACKPMLLPKESVLTKLYIQFIHILLCHGGVRDVLSHIRSEFWIPQGRQVVRGVIRSCVPCRKIMAKPYPTQESPKLPITRTQKVEVFENIGLDYAGPIYIKQSKRGKLQKAYILLITCCVSRAIHLELVKKLNVSEFMMGFRRFVSRRGIPSVVKSDNAQTFKCVAKEFNKILSHPKMEKYIGDHRIKWEFYLERAPWWGGWIERLVGIVKKHLRKVIGKDTLSSDELTTLLYEIEAVVNSRPITFLYDRVEEGEAITPSLLIAGKKLTQLPPLFEVRVENKEPQICRGRLKYMEKLKTYFWNRFQKEYLAELTERHALTKVSSDNRQAKVGDVVLLKNEMLPRSYWRLGRIISVKPGSDGIVRSARVKIVSQSGKKVKYTELNRSPKLLVPLECD